MGFPFIQGGLVESARVMLDGESEESMGVGVVTVSSVHSAAALTQQSHVICEHCVVVECDCDSERRLFVRRLPFTVDDEGLRWVGASGGFCGGAKSRFLLAL